MKLLLDTCTFLWAIADPDRLPRRVADLILFEEHEVYLSAASAWKSSSSMRGSPASARAARFVRDQRDAAGIQSLAVDEESALHVSDSGRCIATRSTACW